MKGLIQGVTAVAIAACSGVAGADVVTDWNNAWIDAIRVTGGAPGPIARAGAMLHVAMFDAINSVDHAYEPYHMHLTVPKGTSKEAAGAAAAHEVLTTLYDDPALIKAFDSLLAQHLDAVPDGQPKKDGIVLGVACASGITALRANDGWDNNDPYVPGANPGDWIPTPPDFSPPITPNWGAVDPWTMESGDQFRPVGPAGFTDMAALLASPEYYEQWEDVRQYGAIDSKVRTPYQTETARFWANDRNGTHKPPGHLNYITQVIAADRGNTLDQNARLFALVNLSLADAGVVAWDCKYVTSVDLWRPVTGIMLADSDGNRQTVGDPNWVPLSHDPEVNGFSPAFPAYISGHSTFAAAHAAAVAAFYGTDDITFTVTSDDTPGVYRTYNSLSEAALENGRSRIYLGVHWQFDADDGYIAGTSLAEHIATNFLRRLGDLDGNGAVDFDDFTELLANWGPCNDCDADLDGNGQVDFDDFTILLSNWG